MLVEHLLWTIISKYIEGVSFMDFIDANMKTINDPANKEMHI